MKKNFELPKEFATKWLEALRSGKYTQGFGMLTDKKYDFLPNFVQNTKFCCLGVAGHICGHTLKELSNNQYLEVPTFKKVPTGITNNGSNPLVLILSSLNDGLREDAYEDYKSAGYVFRHEKPTSKFDRYSLNFAQIADFIEDNVEFV